MSILIEFVRTMFSKESSSRIPTSPPSSFLQRACRTFGTYSTMPLAIGNSLQSPSSSRRTPTFSRLDSTGETIEVDIQPTVGPPSAESFTSLPFGQSLIPNHNKICAQMQSARLNNSFPSISYPSSSSLYPVTSMAQSLSPAQKSVPWMCFSPCSSPSQKSTTTVTGPQKTPQMTAVRSSQSLIPSTSTTTISSTPSTQLRMTASCSSLPSSKVAPGPTGSNGTVFRPSAPCPNMPNHPVCTSSPKKEVCDCIKSIINPRPVSSSSTEKDLSNNLESETESPTKQVPDQCRYRLTMHMSSPESEMDSQNQQSDSRSNQSAMAEVNVQVQFASPPCSIKSRKKKARPSSKKRKRNHQKRDSAHLKHSNTLPESPVTSPRKRHTSQSSCSGQSPQSFTVTFLDFKDSSLDSTKSPPNGSKDKSHSQFSFLIRQDLESESENEEEDDVDISKDNVKSPSICSKILAVVQPSDFESESESSGTDSEESEDEGWDEEEEDEGWDEEEEGSEEGTDEDLWQSFSNQGLVNFNFTAFTCSITPTKTPESPHIQHDQPTKDEKDVEVQAESEAAKEARLANERWMDAYSSVEVQPKSSKVKTVKID